MKAYLVFVIFVRIGDVDALKCLGGLKEFSCLSEIHVKHSMLNKASRLCLTLRELGSVSDVIYYELTNSFFSARQ
jgi:hypothetical protein